MTLALALRSCLLTSLLSAAALGQSTPSACPITFKSFSSDGVSARIENTSGKTIAGLSFYAAIADPTEHWKWVRYDLDPARPLREFGWNKTIKPSTSKTLSWDENLDFYHGGGGVFVLTDVLFSDGTSWEQPANTSPCRIVWYSNHKKSFLKPIDLPLPQ
jgi:hypothetical protein